MNTGLFNEEDCLFQDREAIHPEPTAMILPIRVYGDEILRAQTQDVEGGAERSRQAEVVQDHLASTVADVVRERGRTRSAVPCPCPGSPSG